MSVMTRPESRPPDIQLAERQVKKYQQLIDTVKETRVP
jgi:hypothetical protein